MIKWLRVLVRPNNTMQKIFFIQSFCRSFNHIKNSLGSELLIRIKCRYCLSCYPIPQIKRCKSCEHRKPTPYQHYPPYVSLPDNCYKRPRLSSADTDYTILPAATTYNTASPSNSPLPADGKAVQFFLVKNDGSEPSSQEASPMRRHFAVTSSVERSPPQLYIVKTTTTMTNGDADPLVTSSVNNHNETVIHNGRSTQGVIRSFNPPSSKPHSGRTHKLTTDSLWEEIIEGCGVSRTFLSAPVVSYHYITS